MLPPTPVWQGRIISIPRHHHHRKIHHPAHQYYEQLCIHRWGISSTSLQAINCFAGVAYLREGQRVTPRQHHKHYWQGPTPTHSIICIPGNKWLLHIHPFGMPDSAILNCQMVNRDIMWGLSKLPLPPSVNKIIYPTTIKSKPPRSDRPEPSWGGEKKYNTKCEYDTHVVS